jgi:hypothetical protein
MIGVMLITSAGFSWLFLLPIEVHGHAANPYIGILVFLFIPILFICGLTIVPIGLYLTRKRLAQGLLTLPDRGTYMRRLATFFAVTTAINILIGTQGTYRAAEHMETVQFCGQTCHVMTPESVSHENSPHARVPCVQCHVAPGASGWLESKMAGTRQLFDVILNTYPRPIKSAITSDRLIPARESCEQCHWPPMFDAVKLRVIFHYANDAANTKTETVLMMMTGGGRLGGIHGAHMGSGVEIAYAASDRARQTIPLVQYRKDGEVRTYLASGSTPESVAGLTWRRMQCTDCHNRPTHTFELPERAVDNALGLGQIPALPFIRKKAVELLKAVYSSNEEAAREIPLALDRDYRSADPKAPRPRKADIDKAGQEIIAIYNRNVFPDLKVTWGTYPNNLGHTDFPGCFRCHDGAHLTNDGKTITQDCNVCHEPVAVEETAPEVLKTLGLADRIKRLQQPDRTEP